MTLPSNYKIRKRSFFDAVIGFQQRLLIMCLTTIALYCIILKGTKQSAALTNSDPRKQT
jgi:hypothetical protein